MEGEITFLDITGSTNDDARAMVLEGRTLPFFVVARQQTMGRGRSGNTWISPRGGLYLSAALVMDTGLRQWYGPASAVWVREVVEDELGVDLELKWPNDFLISGRKVGGQLLEAFEHQGRWVLILGIGINCNSTPTGLPPGSFEPTSLGRELGRNVDVDELARAIVKKFNDFNRLRDYVPGLRQEYVSHLSTLGKDVRVLLPGGKVLEGRAIGVENDFSLIVDTAQGRVTVTAGDLVHVRHAGPHGGTT